MLISAPIKLKLDFAQIKTGEGKTTIVAMLAAIKALEGVEDPAFPGKRINQVDIITSSSELAKPQSEEQEKYFALFGTIFKRFLPLSR